MPRRSEHDLEKVTIRLYRGDKEALQKYAPELGYNGVIRHLVHKFIRTMDTAAAKGLSELEKIDVRDLKIDVSGAIQPKPTGPD